MTKNKRYQLSVLLLLAVTLLATTSISAQQATDSASAADEVIEMETITFEQTETKDEGTSQILQNLENLVRDDNQSQEIKNQYDDVVSHARGFIAQVSSLKDDSFKITTPSGEELLIVPDKSTTIVKNGEAIAGNQAVMTDWLVVDDWLVLIGIQNGESFQPRRILVSGESLEPATNFVRRGTVKSATSIKVDIEFPSEDGSETATFNFLKSSDLVNQDNETITYKDLKAGTPVLVVGETKGASKSLQTLRLI